MGFKLEKGTLNDLLPRFFPFNFRKVGSRSFPSAMLSFPYLLFPGRRSNLFE